MLGRCEVTRPQQSETDAKADSPVFVLVLPNRARSTFNACFCLSHAPTPGLFAFICLDSLLLQLSMDPPTTSLNSSNSQEMDPQPALATTLDSPVAAHLAPTNLPLNKAQRAWDRRPQSPFSRKKVRFGKVWKRSGAPSGDATSMFEGSYALQAMGLQSPGKAVKKMRLDHGPAVVNWDSRGSPDRRIATRSSRAEELVALDEDESQGQDAQVEEEEVLRVEIVGEDGAVQEMGADEELQQDEWEDESVTEEEVWDATMMHLGEAC
ncbi:hypothetical protein MRB53_041276 [Persea americana]|nr:hypothetical protein MRB53_041276 [Persea americana]